MPHLHSLLKVEMLVCEVQVCPIACNCREHCEPTFARFYPSAASIQIVFSSVLVLTAYFSVRWLLDVTSTSLNLADRRVVVTGMGITSCLGNTLEDVTKSLKEAEPGISFQEKFAELGIKSNVAGVPELTEADFKELIPKSALRFMGTNAKYAYIAMDRAVQDSGLKPEEYEENRRVCAIIGQGGTSIPDIVETCDAVLAGGKRWKNKVGPFRVTRSMGSTCSAVLATNFKVQGPSYSISSACSTGAHCIGTGFEQILLDKADIAFCGAGKLLYRFNVIWCKCGF